MNRINGISQSNIRKQNKEEKLNNSSTDIKVKVTAK